MSSAAFGGRRFDLVSLELRKGAHLRTTSSRREHSMFKIDSSISRDACRSSVARYQSIGMQALEEAIASRLARRDSGGSHTRQTKNGI